MSKQLEDKRNRVLSTYFEALIDRAERDRRLEQIKKEQEFCRQKLTEADTRADEISAESLAEVFGPLQNWLFLSRTDKRRLLQTIIPEIHIQNYNVTKLALWVRGTHRDEMNHTGRDSWPRPA